MDAAGTIRVLSTAVCQYVFWSVRAEIVIVDWEITDCPVFSTVMTTRAAFETPSSYSWLSSILTSPDGNQESEESHDMTGKQIARTIADTLIICDKDNLLRLNVLHGLPRN